MYTPLAMAEAFLQTGELEEALDALNSHLRDFPVDDYARRLRVQVLLDLPDGQAAALADLDELIMPTGRDAGLRGRILAKMGDFPGAAAAFEQAWRQYPASYAEPYARILLRLGEIDQALAALAVLPKTWQWYSWNADIYDLRGDAEQAVEYYTNALEGLAAATADTDDPRFLQAMRANEQIKRAQVLWRLGHFADADADYIEAETIMPDDAAIPFNRGLLYMEQGDLNDAISLCGDAWERANPDLRAAMHAELTGDPRYQPLLDALLGSLRDDPNTNA